MRDIVEEKSTELGVNLNSCSESDRAIIYRLTLEQIQVFFDTTDLRLVESDDIRGIEKGLSSIIGWLNSGTEKSFIPVPVKRPILRNLRKARTELFNALDNEHYTEKNRRLFYSCLTKCQEHLSEAAWKLVPFSDIRKDTPMSGFEPIATAALTKAVDFLFEQAGKIMEERRDNRKKLGEDDDTPEQNSDKGISSKEKLNNEQPKIVFLKDYHQEIEHCLKQIHQYRSNRRHTLDQIAHQGGINHASIGTRNDLITAENEIKRWSQDLKSLVEKVYGHKLQIYGLN